MEDKKLDGVLIGGISLPLDADESEAKKIAANEIKRAGISPARINFNVYKRSVDARKKDDIRFVYSIAAKFDEPRNIRLPKANKYPFSELHSDELSFTYGNEKTTYPPLVVGMGPAGMFAALLMAENGYRPIIIDRGDNIANRVKCYENFVKFGVLDTESNIQFGAGGAGTFSDGKLLTRINDPRISYVLNRFYDFGAPSEILSAAKPHIGTDLLVDIVDKILARIEELGGKVIYRCCMKDIVENSDGTVTAKTTKGDIVASSVILALGHSSRDTYYTLLEKGFAIDAKSFSVGVRVEHLRADIDKALYGDFAGHPKLGKGEYHLSDTTTGRGVYTFCMCPGGVVVAGASEENSVVVNGMSYYARDGVNSNSAVAVSVRAADYGGTPHKAIEFQRNLERTAFEHGGRNYYAPVQTVGDFLNGKSGTEPSRIIPTYRDGKYKCADMNKIFPEFVSSELKLGLNSFDRKLSGFACSDAILTGVETRTSAPVRILRGEDMCAIGHDRIYPCGEGAGYAGGITSSAVDGIRVAIKIMERFQPIDVDFGGSCQ
jgi:uncharacterized FAD-dependent dehydrogenase